MKCHNCGKTMKKEIVTYRYVESGLDNVYLEGVAQYTCAECDEKVTMVPRPLDLHIVMAIDISDKPTPLTGPEIRFLRKEIGMTGKKFAEFIGVSPVTLSRWENAKDNANREASSERLIRLAFKIMMCEKLRSTASFLEELIRNARVSKFKKENYFINTEQLQYITFPSTDHRSLFGNQAH